MGKYNINQTITDDRKVNLQWHGEDTLVLVKGDSEKTEVKTGDVLSVSATQAKELLAYSRDWTLEGDTPEADPFKESQKKLAIKKAKEAKEAAAAAEKARAARKAGVAAPVAPEKDPEDEKELDIREIDAETADRDVMVKALKQMAKSFNKSLGDAKLRIVLKEAIEEWKAKNPEEGTETEDGIVHYITQEDIDNNPEAFKKWQSEYEETLEIGDWIYIPKAAAPKK